MMMCRIKEGVGFGFGEEALHENRHAFRSKEEEEEEVPKISLVRLRYSPGTR